MKGLDGTSLMVFGDTGKLLDEFWLRYRTREKIPGISAPGRQKNGGGISKFEKRSRGSFVIRKSDPRQLRN